MKKFSKGMRKYIRRRKSEIRKQIIDLKEQEKVIKEFLASLSNFSVK